LVLWFSMVIGQDRKACVLTNRDSAESFKKKIKSKEFIIYLIVGVIVTLVNWLTYTLLFTIWQNSNWRLANFIAIFTSILVAYFLNRNYVFQSKANIFPEIIYFFASRLVISAIFEHGVMELMINVLNFNPVLHVFQFDFPIIKVIGSVFVIIGNYIVGKFLIFSEDKYFVKRQSKISQK